MAGVIMRKDLAQQLDAGSQPQTFAANALSAAVCMKNIDIIRRDELITRAAEIGQETIKALQVASERLDIIGEVRGRGLMIGIELVADRDSRKPVGAEVMEKVVGGLLAEGVIMVPCGRYGNVLRLMPSLTITRDYLKKATDILVSVLEAC